MKTFGGVTIGHLSSMNSNGLLLSPAQLPSTITSDPTFVDLQQISYYNDGSVENEEIVNIAMIQSTLWGFGNYGNWVLDVPDNPHGISEPGGVSPVEVGFYYNADNQVTQELRFDSPAGSVGFSTDGPSTFYAYDPAGRLLNEVTYENSNILANYVFPYNFDADNRILSETYSDGPGSTISTTFTYTATGELASENDSGEYNSAAYAYSFGNTYDDNGNLTNAGDWAGPNNQVNTQGSLSYLYDPDGSRLLAYASGSVYNDYIFDSRNRLSGVIAPASSQTVGYTYNAMNQLMEEQNVGTTVNSLFDYSPSGDLVMQYQSWGVSDLYLPDSTGSPQAGGGVAPLAHEDAWGNVTWLRGQRGRESRPL